MIRFFVISYHICISNYKHIQSLSALIADNTNIHHHHHIFTFHFIIITEYFISNFKSNFYSIFFLLKFFPINIIIKFKIFLFVILNILNFLKLIHIKLIQTFVFIYTHFWRRQLRIKNDFTLDFAIPSSYNQYIFIHLCPS